MTTRLENQAVFDSRISVVITEKKKLVVKGLGNRAVKNNAFPPKLC